MGTFGGRTYAYVVLERVGSVMVYDLTDPAAPQFVEYQTTRNLDVAPVATDSGPEAAQFLPAPRSPVGRPLLFVSH